MQYPRISWQYSQGKTQRHQPAIKDIPDLKVYVPNLSLIASGKKKKAKMR